MRTKHCSPEPLGRYIKGIWKVVKMFLPERTSSKFCMFGTDYKNELAKVPQPCIACANTHHSAHSLLTLSLPLPFLVRGSVEFASGVRGYGRERLPFHQGNVSGLGLVYPVGASRL